tara:strand:+ start:9852 stop:10841 length:990 start_codon:yes stop_codon:yes gene_type:complete
MRDPAFWHELDLQSRRSAPMTRLMLTPIASLYAWAGARRIEKAEPFDVGIPVICIGNLTVGGSGKTPIVKMVRNYLSSLGIRAASLSRGYRGKLKGPLKVDPGTHSAADVGDEPRMLAESGEAWIGADRVAAAEAMKAEGVQVIIMDDGHQNPTLQKDYTLIVIDGGNPVGNGFVFPKGPLREPVRTGLERADAVIVMGEVSEDAPLPDFGGLPVTHGRVEPSETLPAGPFVAFAGIGRPQKFFDTLEGAGAELSEAVPFPDHHSYTARDIQFLKQLADEREARLITTEKDFARLSAADREDISMLPVEARFDGNDFEALLAPLIRTLS